MISARDASLLAERLLALLDEEFEVLKVQNLDAFESLQPEKGDIIKQLSGLALPEDGPESLAWDGFRAQIRDCADRHRRNEILIQRKLEAIRAALKTLQGPDPLNAVEVYDRMGRMSSARRGRGLADA